MRKTRAPSSRRRWRSLGHAIPFALAAMGSLALGDAPDRPDADTVRLERRERIVKSAAARQAFQRARPQGDVDVNGRFSGVVDVDAFIETYGSPEALVSTIAATAHPHTSEQGYVLSATTDESPAITTRSTTGDCFIRAYAAHAAVLEAAANGKPAPSAKDLRREALVPCLTASDATDLESAYEVREGLIDRWPTVHAADYSDDHALHEARFVEYCKRAVTELKREGVAYAEQAMPIAALQEELRRDVFTPARCGGAGAPVVRWLASLPPSTLDQYATLTSVRSLLSRDDVGGLEIAATAHDGFDETARRGLSTLYAAVGDAAVVRGRRLVLRIDLHDTAAANLDVVLDALDGLRTDGRMRRSHVIVRIGGASEATPPQARRMRDLGAIAEVSLATTARGEPLVEHPGFLSMIYYQGPQLVAGGGRAATGSDLRGSYRRAYDVIEQFLSGARTVRVTYDAATMASLGVIPSADGTVALTADQLDARALEHFISAYGCLVDAADQYRTWMTAGSSPATLASDSARVHADCPRLRP
jgi:hypothetical protein